jgi:Fe-S oxidoreductase
VEFLHDILKVDTFPWAEFPHKVALHNNCQALRGLGIASMSELGAKPFSKPMNLLGKVKGIEFVQLAGPDECCGFSGAFRKSSPKVPCFDDELEGTFRNSNLRCDLRDADVLETRSIHRSQRRANGFRARVAGRPHPSTLVI